MAIAAVFVIDDLISAVFEFIADTALIILVIGFVIFGGAALVSGSLPDNAAEGLGY